MVTWVSYVFVSPGSTGGEWGCLPCCTLGSSLKGVSEMQETFKEGGKEPGEWSHSCDLIKAVQQEQQAPRRSLSIRKGHKRFCTFHQKKTKKLFTCLSISSTMSSSGSILVAMLSTCLLMNSLQIIWVECVEHYNKFWIILIWVEKKPACHWPDVVECPTLNEDQDLKVLGPEFMRAPLKAHVPDIWNVSFGRKLLEYTSALSSSQSLLEPGWLRPRAP